MNKEPAQIPEDAGAGPLDSAPPSLEQLLPELQEAADKAEQASRPAPPLSVKLAAYQLFLTTDMAPEAIALSLNIDLGYVQHWVESERWGQRKAQYHLELARKFEAEYQAFALGQRLSVARRHLELAQNLEDEIAWTVQALREERERLARILRKEPNSPELMVPKGRDSQLLKLAQAAKHATDISARVVGLAEGAKMEASNLQQNNTVIVLGGKPLEKVVPIESSDRVSSKPPTGT